MAVALNVKQTNFSTELSSKVTRVGCKGDWSGLQPSRAASAYLLLFNRQWNLSWTGKQERNHPHLTPGTLFWGVNSMATCESWIHLHPHQLKQSRKNASRKSDKASIPGINKRRYWHARWLGLQVQFHLWLYIERVWISALTIRSSRWVRL